MEKANDFELKGIEMLGTNCITATEDNIEYLSSKLVYVGTKIEVGDNIRGIVILEELSSENYIPTIRTLLIGKSGQFIKTKEISEHGVKKSKLIFFDINEEKQFYNNYISHDFKNNFYVLKNSILGKILVEREQLLDNIIKKKRNDKINTILNKEI